MSSISLKPPSTLQPPKSGAFSTLRPAFSTSDSMPSVRSKPIELSAGPPRSTDHQALALQAIDDVFADANADGVVVGSDPAGEVAALEHAVDQDDRHASRLDCVERLGRGFDPGATDDQAVDFLAEQIFDIGGELCRIALRRPSKGQ